MSGVDSRIDGSQLFGTFSIQNKEFYEKTLLKNLKQEVFLYDYAKKTVMPKKHGDTISWRVFKDLRVPTAPLLEGVTPDPNNLEMIEFKTTIKEYGDYIRFSNLIDLLGIDPFITETSELFGVQIAQLIDNLIRAELEKSINVLYAGDATSRDGLDSTSANIITTTDIINIVRIMKRYNVKPLKGGDYVMFIHPDVEFDLKSATGNGSWLDINKYADNTPLLKGEIGKMLGVRFVVDNNISVIENTVGEGQSAVTYNVYKNIVLGRDAFGTVELEGAGAKPSLIHKPLGSAGTADPLNQQQTLGWHIEGFATRILYDEAVLIYECLSAADTISDLVDANRNHYNNAETGNRALTRTLATPVLTAGTNKVTWNAITGADAYVIYSSATSNGTFTVVGTTRNTEQTVSGTEYYKVMAIGATGASSALSNAATKSSE